MERKTKRPNAASAAHPGHRRGLILFAAMLALAAASLFASSSSSDLRQEGVTIPYGDLDLSTVDGALELERRLVEAAGTVCAGLDSPALPREQFERCRMDAVAGAILTLRRPPSALAVVSS